MKQSNQTFEICGKEELAQLSNLVQGFIETNQKVNSSGSVVMTADIRAAKDLSNKIDSAEDYLLVHENEVVFLQGVV